MGSAAEKVSADKRMGRTRIIVDGRLESPRRKLLFFRPTPVRQLRGGAGILDLGPLQSPDPRRRNAIASPQDENSWGHKEGESEVNW